MKNSNSALSNSKEGVSQLNLKMFFFKVLIPLHRPRSLPLYHESLTLCMTQFLERDESLVDEMMNRLLPLWPRIQTAKSIKFINEVESILEKVHNYDKENQVS